MMSSKKKSLPQQKAGNEKFDQEWSRMQQSFQELKEFIIKGCIKFDNEHVSRNMYAYTVVYNICTKHQSAKNGVTCAQELYRRLKEMIENHLKESVTDKVIHKTGDALLQKVHKEWKTHGLIVKWARFMFRYLDDYYTKSPQIDNLSTMMLKGFERAVFQKIKTSLRNVILTNIESERDGNTIDREVLRSAIWLFIDMGMETTEVYNQDFEKEFIKQSREYYQREAQRWQMEPGGQYTYLKKVEQKNMEEARRADSYLAPTTKGTLLKAIEQELLVTHMDKCLEDADAGTEALLNNERNDELGRMYRLFKNNTTGLERMADIVRRVIEKEGKQINSKFSSGGTGETGEAASTTYIKSCLALHDKYSQLFSTYLENNEQFLKARKTAYEVFVNPQQGDPWVLKQKTKGGKDGMDVVTTSELLSTYIDGIMKKEMESEEALDSILDKCVTLFTYIHDKDLFQQFYMKQMSRRLMHNKNQHLLDQERTQISKLKMKMGSAYTSKLEGMLADQGVADNQNKHFKEYLSDFEVKLPIDFTPLVLTTGFWPAFKHDTLSPPTGMNTCLSWFEKFYEKNTQSRKLTWIHSLGHASVVRKFPKGPREMSVTTYQACILVLFNETGSVVAKQAQETLKLPFEEIKRTFHSLAYGKFPVIKRADGNKALKQVKEADEFMVCIPTPFCITGLRAVELKLSGGYCL